MPRGKTTKTTTKRKTATVKTKRTTTRNTQHYGTVADMANDVRGVLKSIINQDGRYDTKEASVVGKLYGCELTRMKLQVEIHKANANTSKAEEVLSLT